MSKRTNTAVWMENQQRWQIKVQKRGERRTFYSSAPGRKGQREANTKADRWLDDGINGNIKVARLFPAFLEDQKARNGTGSYVNNESIGRNWILPTVGRRYIYDLTVQDLQNILNKANKKGLANKTLCNIRGTITAFLRFARKSNTTTLYPDDLVIPRGAPKGKRKVLQENHINILFTSSKTTHQGIECADWYINAYRFLAAVGLRPGELCELQRRQQSDKKNVTVHGSYNKFKEHTTGKNDNANRTFILFPLAEGILKDQELMLKKAGIVSPYLFPDLDGKQATSRRLYKRWQRYQTVNGFTKDEHISLYELRHTFVSLCKKKIPEALIKPFIGHSTKMPSYDTYGHQMKGEMELVANMLEEIYTDILQKEAKK